MSENKSPYVKVVRSRTKETLVENKRCTTLDIAKGIGMIFVIFAHVNYTPDILVLIYSFHMPLFFILSGVSFDRLKYPSFSAYLARRWKNMILPYLLFSVISIAYVILSSVAFYYTSEFTMVEYIAAFLQIFLAQGSAPVMNTPLWFIPCLFAVEIMYFFISKLKPYFVLPICICLSCFGWVLESGMLAFDNTLLPWSLDSALFALSFYAIGNLASPYLKKAIAYIKDNKYKILICIGITALCVAAWLPLALMNGKISLGSKELNNGFLLYMTGILGTVGILAISILLEKVKFLNFLGTNTFCLMSVHYMVRRFMIPKYYRMMGRPLYNDEVLSETIVPFIIVFVLSILLTLGYNAARKHLQKEK